MSVEHTRVPSAARQVGLGLGIGLLASAGWALAQRPAGPTAREREAFRASLTAMQVLAGRAADSAHARCRPVSIEWQPLPGAVRYLVEESVAAPGSWTAVHPDPRCSGAGLIAPTGYRDRVVPAGPRLFYRVVALGRDGHELAATAPVPVDVR